MMKIETKQNLIYHGVNNRAALLDVIYPKIDAPLPIVFFAHGFKGFKDWGHFPLMATNIALNGCCVIKFNFSHNGATVKNPIDFPDLAAFAENTYWKEMIDLSKLLQWVNDFNFEKLLKIKVDKNNIQLIGHSRGGGIAICAAAKYKSIKKVITWSAVADFHKRLPRANLLRKWKAEGVYFMRNARTKQNMPMNYSFVDSFFKHQQELNIKNAIEAMTQDLLIIHGTNDESVDVSEGIQLQKWKPDAKLCLIEGAGHTFGGKHPWQDDQLPEHSQQLLQATIDFIPITME